MYFASSSFSIVLSSRTYTQTMAEVTARLAKREKNSAIVLSFFQILDLNSKLEERVLSPLSKIRL